jgi:hypothetical protein
MAPTDPSDGVFKLAVILLDDRISDQPRLRNPEIDGSPDSASTRISFGALGSSQCIRRLMGLSVTYYNRVLNDN